ncbi:MAG: hypothetical protein WC882_03725 [Candidatus Gracilibacteria bacterium]
MHDVRGHVRIRVVINRGKFLEIQEKTFIKFAFVVTFEEFFFIHGTCLKAVVIHGIELGECALHTLEFVLGCGGIRGHVSEANGNAIRVFFRFLFEFRFFAFTKRGFPFQLKIIFEPKNVFNAHGAHFVATIEVQFPAFFFRGADHLVPNFFAFRGFGKYG